MLMIKETQITPLLIEAYHSRNSSADSCIPIPAASSSRTEPIGKKVSTYFERAANLASTYLPASRTKSLVKNAKDEGKEGNGQTSTDVEKLREVTDSDRFRETPWLIIWDDLFRQNRMVIKRMSERKEM